jgi:hypothetical protein
LQGLITTVHTITLVFRKQGLNIIKRNKRSFHAQEMLLLPQLAYNLLIWFRSKMAHSVPCWLSFGILRLIRDGFPISGFVEFDHNNRVSATAVQVVNARSEIISMTSIDPITAGESADWRQCSGRWVLATEKLSGF